MKKRDSGATGIYLKLTHMTYLKKRRRHYWNLILFTFLNIALTHIHGMLDLCPSLPETIQETSNFQPIEVIYILHQTSLWQEILHTLLWHASTHNTQQKIVITWYCCNKIDGLWDIHVNKLNHDTMHTYAKPST